MKSIRCPKCKAMIRTRVGIIAKAATTYSAFYDLFGSFRWATDKAWDIGIKRAEKEGLILDFYCLGCGKLFSPVMQIRIMRYLKAQMVLEKLKKSS